MMLRLAEAIWGVGTDESLTWTVKSEVPVAMGVPEITPLPARDKPTGNVPPVRLQV